MTKKSELIVLLLFFFLGLNNITAFGELVAKISLEKSQFFVLEPVLIHYEVKNAGTEPVKIWIMELANSFVVLDQQKKRYYPSAIIDYMGQAPEIKPSETVATTVNLNGYGSPVTSSSYTPALPAGRYIVHLEARPEEGEKAVSNVLEFDVINPSGLEKLAQSHILEADSLMRSKKRELAYKKMLEIHTKYPSSVYVPYSLFRAFILYPYDDKTELLGISREFIEKYPNSHYVNDALSALIDYYRVKKDREGATKELREYMNKYPNSKTSKYAEIKLKALDKLEF